MHPLLERADQDKLNVWRFGAEGIGFILESNKLFENCRIAVNQAICWIPRKGYINQLEIRQRTPLGSQLMKEEDYEAQSDEIKEFYYVYENNVGTKYLVSCPYSCKFFDFSASNYLFLIDF